MHRCRAQGMSLTYQLKGSGIEREIRIAFDPPLLGYEEVKPRLMGMKAEAEEELGMVRLVYIPVHCGCLTVSRLTRRCRPGHPKLPPSATAPSS